jgi:hypothetical protein
MSRLRLALVAMITAGALGCQDYPFEIRLPKRVSARKLNEVVATVRPTDILLVVDTSGSMLEEHLLLKSNVASFVEELLDNNVDFHLGIIAPDMECNIPERSCTAPDGPDGNTNPDAAPGGVSSGWRPRAPPVTAVACARRAAEHFSPARARAPPPRARGSPMSSRRSIYGSARAHRTKRRSRLR